MRFKRIFMLLCLIVCLFAMASVCANDTTMASEDAGLELSAENEIDDNLQTNEENSALAVEDNDETATAKTDSEILTADQLTYSNLRDKIGTGGNITLTKGTYTYNDGDGGTIVISDSGVINGNGAIIDMAGSTIQAFYVGGSGITIKNLTIKNANYNGEGGAIYFSKSGTVENCNFTNNKATGDYSYGGAIYFSKSGTVENCNFTNNKATGDYSYGGAICFWGTGNVTNCNFTDNTASRNGGAVYFKEGNVTNCTFTNNNASEQGGAIHFDKGSSNTVINCNFTDNTAFMNGGAVCFLGLGSVEICNFIGNNATSFGGTVYFKYNGSVANCTFSDNSAGRGGGAILMVSGIVTYCNFTNNQVTNGDGGAIWMNRGTVTNCNFIDNKATGDESSGGAVYFVRSGTVENCNFTNNRASDDGGALYMGSGTVINSMFINNVAGRSGAILSYNLWSVTADTCIFKTDSDSTYQVHILPPILNVDNFTSFYGSGEKLTFDLKTNSSIPITDGNISISVYFKDNNSWVGNYSCLSGEGWTVNLPVGSYYAIFDTEYAEFKPINRTITVNKAKTELLANPITATYNTNKNLIITLKDKNGNPVAGVSLSVDLNGAKNYITDKNGQVKISVGKLTPKTYNVKITFGENENYLASSAIVKVTVKKAKSKIIAKKKTYKAAKKIKKYTVTLKSGKTPIKKVKLTLKINKKTYKAKTNKKGKAIFKIKLNKKGKYKATITFKANKYYNKATKKVKITVK